MALTTKETTVVTIDPEPINGMTKKQEVDIKKVTKAGQNKLFVFRPIRPASKAPLIWSIGTTAVMAVDTVTASSKFSLR